MRLLVALVVGLVVSLVGALTLGAPAEAAYTRVTSVSAYAAVVSGKPVMTGRINGTSREVRIEAYRSGRWVLVQKVPAYYRYYRANLRVASTSIKYRAGVSGVYSRTRTIAGIRPSDACGTIRTKADGTAWSCTFSDNFSASTLDATKWTAQAAFAMGSQGAHTCYVDDPSTIQIANGSLNLSVREVAEPVSCDFGGLTGPTNYVSGSVMTYRLFSQQYGRFEVRVKNTATTAPGLHEAFWLWPDDRVASTEVWPYAGEIDVSETYSSHPGLSIPFLHYSADVYGTLLGVNTAWDCSASRGVWNTYALEWTATKLQIFVNGKSCLTNLSGNKAFQKPYIMALTQGLGAAGNVYDGRAPLGTMSIDYVRVWQ